MASVPPERELSPEEKEALERDIAELDRLQRRYDDARDEDIREAYALQIQALGIRIRQMRFAVPPVEQAQGTPLPLKVAAEADDSLPDPPTPQQLDEAERLIRMANVEKVRGNNQKATDLLEQAAAAAPGAVSVQIALGDALMERRQLGKAREAYKRAMRIDPSSAEAERKYAAIVVAGASGGRTIEEQLRAGLSDQPTSDVMAASGAAKWLSALLPGAGQIVLGQTTKGGILLGTFVFCIAMIVILRQDFQELTKLAAGQPASPNLLVLLPMFGIVVVWFISIAGVGGGKVDKPRPKVDRPRPPVDLPFE